MREDDQRAGRKVGEGGWEYMVGGGGVYRESRKEGEVEESRGQYGGIEKVGKGER